MRLHSMGWRLVVGFVGFAAPAALADIPYFNGFETAGSLHDFYSPTNVSGGQITLAASGGGTLDYPAAAGGYYAQITNVDGDAGINSQFGFAGYTTFGSEVSTHSATGFQDSVDVYVDLARWQPQVEQQAGSNLVISTQPDTTSGQLPSGAANDLINFIFTVTNAGTVQVSSDASPALATITSSGWYRFVTTFVPGTSVVENDVSVQDLQGNTLGTAHYVSTLPAVQLGGSGDMVFGVWRNGFAGDTIGIDDLQTSAVPEPMTIGVFGAGLALFLRRRR